LVLFAGHGLYSKDGRTYGLDIDGKTLIPIDDLVGLLCADTNSVIIAIIMCSREFIEELRPEQKNTLVKVSLPSDNEEAKE